MKSNNNRALAELNEKLLERKEAERTKYKIALNDRDRNYAHGMMLAYGQAAAMVRERMAECSDESSVLPIQHVSVSFSAEGMEKVDKYHKQTLNKVNNLYKYLYDRTVCATELADQQEEVFAYLRLTDDIKEAYRKFRDSVCGLVNER